MQTPGQPSPALVSVWGVQYLDIYSIYSPHSGPLLLLLLTTATTAGNQCRWGRRISERILDPQPNSSQLYVNWPSTVYSGCTVAVQLYSILISSVSVRAGAGAGLDSGLSQHQSTTRWQFARDCCGRHTRDTATIVEHSLRTSEIIQ